MSVVGLMRETTSPLHALERFADLEALVTFLPDAVRVRLPLGQRYMDLESRGCLAPVPRVPWLNGRSIEFARW